MNKLKNIYIYTNEQIHKEFYRVFIHVIQSGALSCECVLKAQHLTMLNKRQRNDVVSLNKNKRKFKKRCCIDSTRVIIVLVLLQPLR